MFKLLYHGCKTLFEDDILKQFFYGWTVFKEKDLIRIVIKCNALSIWYRGQGITKTRQNYLWSRKT